MRKSSFFFVVMLSVCGSARADQLQSWGQSLQDRLGLLPSAQEYATYPQQFVIVAIMQAPNVPEAPRMTAPPRLADVVAIARARKEYWQAVLEGARTRLARGEEPSAKLRLQAEIAEAAAADADKDLAYLDDLPKMAFDPRVQRRWDEKAALLVLMREKAQALAAD